MHSTIVDQSAVDHLIVDGATQSDDTVEKQNLAPPNYLPADGMAADALYQMLHGELMQERLPCRNLATFGTTWMEPDAQRLMGESVGKNLINRDAYPHIARYEKECIRFLAELWHSPTVADPIGVATTGSSEAAILAGIALMRRWKEHRCDQHSRDQHNAAATPNLILGTNVHVCWKKLCLYLGIEPRYVPCTDQRLTLDIHRVAEAIDENTIGVIAVLGNSYNGTFDSIAELNRVLDALYHETGWSVPIHVDAASGGFVAPFMHPELIWDFRLDRVVSINTSGHKYGLVYPSVGWILWRNGGELPRELIFNVDYLGGDISSFALSFSRPSSQVVAQYYAFLRYGFTGYQEVLQQLQGVSRFIAEQLESMALFEILTTGQDLPVVSWCLKNETAFDLYQLSQQLEEYGWQVPAYRMPENQSTTVMMRAVIKHGFTYEQAHQFLTDVKRAVGQLMDNRAV